MQHSTSTRLPEQGPNRDELVRTIEEHIAYLRTALADTESQQNVDDHPRKIEVLQTRLGLIGRCGEMSIVRINHLEEVFKHYCTNVFRIGKHMTFEKLEYDRVHMTIERFFLFLRDFQLTVAHIDGKSREVLDKTETMKVFKKISSNARVLSFEEFIQSLERLAVMYWDDKANWHEKQRQLQKKKDDRMKLLQKRKEKKEGKAQESQGEEDEQQEEKQDEQEEEKEEEKSHSSKEKKKAKGKAASKVKEQEEAKNEEANKNDGLVDQLMADDDIEDPNEQVRQLAADAQMENEQARLAEEAAKEREESLLQFSKEEKIEYFYQLLGIDTVVSYRNKMTSLNLPNLQLPSRAHKEQKALSESKLKGMVEEEEERLKRLKAKMNEKKEKFKDRPIPKPNNQKAKEEEEKARKRKEAKQVRSQVRKEKKDTKKEPTPKRVEYKESEVSWEAINHLNIEQLRLKKFNPAKIIAPSQDDRYFLEEYGPKPKITERLQARERQSLSIVESTKMRAAELEKNERKKSKRENSVDLHFF